MKTIPLKNVLIKKMVKAIAKRKGFGSFGFSNIWDFTCGKYVMKEGQKLFVPIWHENIHNLVVYEGIDDVLDVYFKGGSQSSTWYIAIFSSDSTPASGWTYATPTYTEFTNYDESTREEWVEGSISSQSLDNSASPAEFTCTSGTNTIYGGSLVNVSTKGDTGTGKMFSAARFTSSRPFNAAEVLKIVVTINGEDV